MSDLVVLPAEPPGEGVIKELAAALARARNGEFSSVVICWVLRDGATGQAWSKPPNVASLLGSMDIGHARITNSILED